MLPRKSESGDQPGGTSILRWVVEINREDLARNGVRPPEDWEPQDLLAADKLGLIYAWEVEIEDA